MRTLVVFGNSGSGKSTLASRLHQQDGLAHLDLDTLAWEPGSPPTRRTTAASMADIVAFQDANSSWVIEGCYADLLQLVLPRASELIYLDLPVQACLANARQRPWEPHKYSSAAAQNANLDMLLDWIRQYPQRNDTFSQQAHQALFDRFTGRKTRLTGNPRSADWVRV